MLRRLSSKADLDRAIRYFDDAVLIDPQYADAYAAAAAAYQFASGLDSVPPTHAYPKADSLARHAIQLDPSNATARAAFGWAAAVLRRDWPLAQREIERAVALDANNAFARTNHGYFLAARGDLRRATEEAAAAIRLDPAFALASVTVSILYVMRNLPDSAVATLNRFQEVAQASTFSGFFLTDAFRLKGQLDTALALDRAAAAAARRSTPGLP